MDAHRADLASRGLDLNNEPIPTARCPGCESDFPVTLFSGRDQAKCPLIECGWSFQPDPQGQEILLLVVEARRQTVPPSGGLATQSGAQKGSASNTEAPTCLTEAHRQEAEVEPPLQTPAPPETISSVPAELGSQQPPEQQHDQQAEELFLAKMNRLGWTPATVGKQLTRHAKSMTGCPHCRSLFLVTDFRGRTRAQCPSPACAKYFDPDPVHQAGLCRLLYRNCHMAKFGSGS